MEVETVRMKDICRECGGISEDIGIWVKRGVRKGGMSENLKCVYLDEEKW